ncbi:putative WD repeat-containing protein C26H5.03 [Golovinomyces cichoracearum]|uniref:Putative WD repeat-containing protein C26H5.03 n=1 Tax=Golovinomyces cichoracearum TaxID=62708 RepID=A0A420HEY8_9PEZI|nr:putative WD repeat-containing protein C26H5.03 [Golovinomyces cichoracearum]
MKASPIIVNWHSDTAPIYSADFQPNGKGRLATAGGDNNVRLWRLDVEGEDSRVEYLCTMTKHTQAVNAVRWAPKSDLLASASDDGNVITWVLDTRTPKTGFGEEKNDDKEYWRTKTMVRTMGGSEVYDLAWSPDGTYFITGSMDNVARIYNAQTGHMVRQIAEHQHYVQGVAWDPLNEYIATQSSDRSVHIYSLRTKDGTYTLSNRDDSDKGLGKVAINLKMDLPGRRICNSPAPPDPGFRSQISHGKDLTIDTLGSPVPSCPGTPTSFSLSINPQSTVSHSRRSSITASSPAILTRRSASPAPSLPLPAVWPMEASPKSLNIGIGVRNANIYVNEMLKSYFRRLTFTPDGSLLLTPAGQFQSHLKNPEEGSKNIYEITNTVYIYTRGGINKPPIAHLPGHKKPPIVVRCSPVYFNPRKTSTETKHLTFDTSSTDHNMTALPEPLTAITKLSHSAMEPPPPLNSNSDSSSQKPPLKTLEYDTPGPPMAFTLPYRMVYAAATEDAVYLYDTQQQTPLCIVSNLHCATFTDLSWSNDGLILLMTSSDGFCSTLTFGPNELGERYLGEVPNYKNHSSYVSNTPLSTPTAIQPLSPFSSSSHRMVVSASPGRPSSRNRQRTNSLASNSSHAPKNVSGIPFGISLNSTSMSSAPNITSDNENVSTTSGSKRDAKDSEADDTASNDDRVKKQKKSSPSDN